MKTILKIFLVFSMILALCPSKKVYALNENDLIEKELELAIISGDGSSDNPYIVDYEQAPYFKEYMDQLNEKVMAELNDESRPGISTYGIYDGILSGQSYPNQNNGGEWEYTSSAPSVIYNGNIWMKKVVYMSINDTKIFYNGLKDTLIKEQLLSGLKNTASKPYTEAIKALVNEKITNELARAALKAVGQYNGLFTAAEILAFVKDLLQVSLYKRAVDNNCGMIKAVYNTAYNGAWYAQKGEDTWTNANEVKLPHSYYGIGRYTSY